MRKSIITILFLLPMLASAQYFDVFDIDTSNYPIMKAKFYSIDANGKQILNHNTSDFEITENGEPRDVISVSCPPQKDEEMYSIALSIDISGSMSGEPIKLGKLTASTIINLFGGDLDEFSLQQCNNKATILNDFTRDKNKIQKEINKIEARGGNDFTEQLLNLNTGLLNIAKAGKGKKIAIIYTDAYWTPLTVSEIQQAITICNQYDIRVYTIIYSRPEAQENGIKSSLREISEKSGGRFYDGVTNSEMAKDIAFKIKSDLNNEPCYISWKGGIICDKFIELKIKNKAIEINSKNKIELQDKQRIKLDTDPLFINIGFINEGESKDTSITLTAKNIEQVISNVYFEPDNGYFEVINTLPIVIPKDESINLMIRYNAIDTSKIYTRIIINTDFCDANFSLLAGSKYGQILQRTLELTHPNGGEVFVAGSDTAITWKGISQKEEVKLNYSSDNGNSWSLISDSAINLRTNWTVPRIQSDSCLISIDQYSDKKSSYIKDGEIEWSKTFGGSSVETANKVIQTKDGGYLTTGETFSNDGDFALFGNYGQNDIFVLKYFFNGDIEWSKTLGGSNHDNVSDILEMSNGNYLVVGSSNSTDTDLKNVSTKGGYDSWLMKLDDTGEIVWTKTFGGTNSDAFNSSISTLDGGYIFVGYSYSDDENLKENGNKGLADAWVLKMDNLGDIEWTKTFGGSNLDYAYCVQQTPDEGYIISGTSKSSDGDFSILGNKGEEDVWVLKLNNVGGTEWFKTYGGKKLDRLRSIIQTDEGGYILAGETMSYDDDLENAGYKGSQDGWVLKMDNLGNIEWTRTYGGSNKDQINAIVQAKNGGYIIGGQTSSYDGDLENIGKSNTDALLIKISDLGEIEWTKTYGGSDGEQIFDMKETLDGGFIFCLTLK